jgi:CoA-transferase family III
MLARRLLDEVLDVLGEEPAREVEFVGGDPVLASPLRIGEAGAACIASAAVMAARLWELRGGRPQHIRVEVDAAAAAMRSSRYVRVLGGQAHATSGGATTGATVEGARGDATIYRTRDNRWMYLHRTFAHHRERQAAFLECDDDQAAVAHAVSAWDGEAIEEANIAAGAAGGLVRTAAEWSAHPQALALEALPLLEIQRIGDSPPEPLPTNQARPLQSVRVLDLTRVLAGPTCARTLAEHGADVLRMGTHRWPDNEAMMRDTGFGKRSCALELDDPAEADTIQQLISKADVFSQGYRPGALAAHGLSPEAVAARRPGIVYVTISAFSHAGPWRDRRGFDSVVQAVSGIAVEHAAPDGKPRFAPANPLDYMTGYLAAAGAMAAVRRRATHGGSYLVRLSLAQTGRWLAALPRVDANAGARELPEARLEQLMQVTETPFGALRHMRPVARMSETPPRWDRPSVPLDHDPPRWE